MFPGLKDPARGSRVVALTVLWVVVAAACGGKASAPRVPEGAQNVSFASSDGVQLDGKLYGRGKVGVILSHQYNSDQSSWFSFAGKLADSGYLVLTYDFRGFCPDGDAGCSSGKKDVGAATKDLEGAIAFMRGKGADKLFLVGASMGGTASLAETAAQPSRVNGVISLSSPISFQGLDANLAAPGDIKTPKLFIAGKDDPAGAAAAAEVMYKKSSDMKQLLIVPTDQHGAFILSGQAGDAGPKAEEAMLAFLDTYGSAA